MEVYFDGGYLVIHDPHTGTGTVYDPQTEQATFPVVCNYGGPGDSFETREDALESLQRWTLAQ